MSVAAVTSLGIPGICTSGDCDFGDSEIRRVVGTHQRLAAGTPKERQVAAAYNATVASYDSERQRLLEEAGTFRIFETVCCVLRDLGLRATETEKEMLRAVGQAVPPPPPKPWWESLLAALPWIIGGAVVLRFGPSLLESIRARRRTAIAGLGARSSPGLSRLALGYADPAAPTSIGELFVWVEKDRRWSGPYADVRYDNILSFARIGSQRGSAREVWRGRGPKAKRLRRYEDGKRVFPESVSDVFKRGVARTTPQE